MPVAFAKRFTVDLCRAHPEALFIFGDNVERRGHAGQAVIRGEPNAKGLPTKWKPAMSEDAFFQDDAHGLARMILPIALIEEKLKVGTVVVFPTDGLGTGLAQLPKRAPKLSRMLAEEVERLVEIYGRHEL